MARNRVIYQSEALFVATGNIVPTGTHVEGDFAQLNRIQSANYGFSINRQNINQFGNLARIDSIILEAPSVNLDFTYLLEGGTNEISLGFKTGAYSTGTDCPSFISGLISSDTIVGASGRNFHILTVQEGYDANGLTANNTNDISGGPISYDKAATISIGNGFITNYTVEASVGNIPTVSVSVEGMNINVVSGRGGNNSNPAVSIEDGALVENAGGFALPSPVTTYSGLGNSHTPTVVRPGDILFALEEGILTDLPTGVDAGNSAAHIQSFSIEVPISRSTLQRLGNRFGYAKVVDFPLDVNVNITANLADLKNSGNLYNVLTTDGDKTFTIQFRNSSKNNVIAYTVRNAKLVSENFSSSIGDNKSVDLVFSAQIGGVNDNTNGIFVGKNGIS